MIELHQPYSEIMKMTQKEVFFFTSLIEQRNIYQEFKIKQEMAKGKK